MEALVLTVDMSGLPQAWVALEDAITYHAKQLVAWSVGDIVREFRGGWQRNGTRSRIATKSILAIKGTIPGGHFHTPGLTNALLFARDRQLCAYCGQRFMLRDLSRDHVIPVSRGGRDVWTNSVTACRRCNTKKANRSPEIALCRTCTTKQHSAYVFICPAKASGRRESQWDAQLFHGRLCGFTISKSGLSPTFGTHQGVIRYPILRISNFAGTYSNLLFRQVSLSGVSHANGFRGARNLESMRINSHDIERVQTLQKTAMNGPA